MLRSITPKYFLTNILYISKIYNKTNTFMAFQKWESKFQVLFTIRLLFIKRKEIKSSSC